MRTFSLYEFASTVVPGTTCMVAFVIGAGVPAPAVELPTSLQVTVFAALSYACGQVMQVLGTGVEGVALWNWREGEPVTWLSPLRRQPTNSNRSTPAYMRLDRMLTERQQACLLASEAWNQRAPRNKSPSEAWELWLRQESVRCRKSDNASRLNHLTSIYALCRGLVVAFLLLGIAFFVKQAIPAGSACMIAAVTLLVRVEQLKVSSTQELLLQMLERDDAKESREPVTNPSPTPAPSEFTKA
jgi:hypothetical protein